MGGGKSHTACMPVFHNMYVGEVLWVHDGCGAADACTLCKPSSMGVMSGHDGGV